MPLLHPSSFIFLSFAQMRLSVLIQYHATEWTLSQARIDFQTKAQSLQKLLAFEQFGLREWQCCNSQEQLDQVGFATKVVLCSSGLTKQMGAGIAADSLFKEGQLNQHNSRMRQYWANAND